MTLTHTLVLPVHPHFDTCMQLSHTLNTLIPSHCHTCTSHPHTFSQLQHTHSPSTILVPSYYHTCISHILTYNSPSHYPHITYQHNRSCGETKKHIHSHKQQSSPDIPDTVPAVTPLILQTICQGIGCLYGFLWEIITTCQLGFLTHMH